MNFDRKIILGCGTGRCGTVTLRRLLWKASGFNIKHEMTPRLPWLVDENKFNLHKEHFIKDTEDLVGNIALDNLNYLEMFFNVFHDLKVIILKRNKEDTIESFVKKSNTANWWIEHNGTRWRKEPINDIMFPKYNVKDKREAIGLYWEEYYNKIEKLIQKYPDRFLLIHTESLSYSNTQRAIYAFCEIPEEDWKFDTKHYNKHDK